MNENNEPDRSSFVGRFMAVVIMFLLAMGTVTFMLLCVKVVQWALGGL
jgi:hypothetical protein